MFNANDMIRSRAYGEGVDLLARQAEAGRRTIERRPWAQTLYDQVREACPNVVQDDLFRLFVGRDEDEIQRIQGDALFLEYNMRCVKDK